MKCASLIAAVALATGSAVAADDVILPALNLTEASLTTRHLQDLRFYRMLGVDVVGKDIHNEQGKSVFDCFGRNWRKLYGGKEATAFVWTNYQNGWCWVKATDYRGTPTTPKAEADTMLLLKDSTSEFIWSNTQHGFDMAGGFDIDNKKGKDMGACFQHCNADTRCFAVTWSDHQGGWCWLKSRASGYLPKANCKSAYVARQFSILGVLG